jgi:hypothetical protein
VQENFGDAADVRGRTPAVFVGGNSFGEADEFAFLDHNFGQEWYPVTPGVPSLVHSIALTVRDGHLTLAYQ